MEPIAYKTKIQVDLDMSAFPKLLALIDRVKAHPRIAQWLQRRPQTECWETWNVVDNKMYELWNSAMNIHNFYFSII